jgi:hypothetical protein
VAAETAGVPVRRLGGKENPIDNIPGSAWLCGEANGRDYLWGRWLGRAGEFFRGIRWVGKYMLEVTDG